MVGGAVLQQVKVDKEHGDTRQPGDLLGHSERN